MRLNRTCCALLATVFLGGCAGIDPLGFYSRPEPEQILVAAPLPAAPPSYDFCQRIAAQDAAMGNPTRDTQLRRREASFRDCVWTFGDA